MTREEFETRLKEKEEREFLTLINHIAKTSAQTRRLVELDGEVARFDDALSEALRKWSDHYASMEKDDILMENFLER